MKQVVIGRPNVVFAKDGGGHLCSSVQYDHGWALLPLSNEKDGDHPNHYNGSPHYSFSLPSRLPSPWRRGQSWAGFGLDIRISPLDNSFLLNGVRNNIYVI